MKKVGKWWITDFETERKVLDMLASQNFGCVAPITAALEYVQKFDNAVDIGAWIGDSPKVLSEEFKKVTAFEASPSVFECCVRNLQEHEVYNVEALNYAISNSNEQKILSSPNSTHSSWINTIDQKGIKVEARTLDSFELEDIDFIKIDVDSHEGYLLQGSQKFFKSNNPVVLMEHKLSIRKRQHKDMPDPVALLEAIGYKEVAQVSHIDKVFVR